MNKIGWLIFGLVVIYFIFLIRQDIIDQLELRKETARVAEKLAQETQLNQQLKNQALELRHGERVEELARTRLEMIKKGETAYKVIID